MCISDCTVDFEIWHLELIAGLVVLISSSRYLLLKTWPDFATSSVVSNKQVLVHLLLSSTSKSKARCALGYYLSLSFFLQVLTSLDTFDYVIVAFLPGISEVRN